MRDRFKIKPAPASDDCVLVARTDIRQGRARQFAKPYCRHCLRQRDLAKQVMPNLTSRLRIRFRRPKVETTIDLKGMGSDDFGGEVFGKSDCSRGCSDR